MNVFRPLLLVTMLLWLIACEEPKDIGLAPTTPIGILYTDTIKVHTSTVQFDSVWTDRTSRLLVGRYADPVFGRVNARAFMQLGLINATQFKTEADMRYDSLKLGLAYSYSYGDTTQIQEVFVHRLTETLDLAKRYTNTNAATFEAESLATFRFTPTSTGGGAFLRLSDSLGQELFNLSKGDGVTDENLRKMFNGLGLLSGTTNTAVLGFSPSNVILILYYHKNGESTVKQQQFALSASLPAFSQVIVDRTGTKLAGLSVSHPLPPTATGGETYVQAATGVTTALEFPTLQKLKEKGKIAINRAELTITTKGSSPGGNIPPYLTLVERNESNQIPYTLQNGNRFFHLVPSETNLTVTDYNAWAMPQVQPYASRTHSYTFNISRYLQTLLTTSRPNRGLALVPISATGITGVAAPSYINNQLNGLILNSTTTARLVVFYTYAP